MASQGTLLVCEGGEGCGKDANIAYLQDRYKERNDVIFTREPGGTDIGNKIRAILMDTSHTNMSVETELLLFLASRAQLMEEVVKPALEQGVHVISNRFALSTIAYQIFRKDRHNYRPFLDAVSEQLLGTIEPYYILLDVEPEVGLRRARGRDEESTRFDFEALETHQKVREGYLDAIRSFPHVIVDANRPLPEVQQEVQGHVESVLFA